MECKSTKDEMFEDIYTRHEKDVYRACLHLSGGDEALAADMTQQAFLKFYERFETTKVECAKAYLIRSARNLLYNYYRDTKKEWKPTEEEEGVLESSLVTEGVEEMYFEDVQRTLAKELSDEIMEELKAHHESWYEILHMLIFLEMNHDEIAEKLGITKDVLYSRLHRAKLWIQKNYKESFDKMTEKA